MIFEVLDFVGSLATDRTLESRFFIVHIGMSKILPDSLEQRSELDVKLIIFHD